MYSPLQSCDFKVSVRFYASIVPVRDAKNAPTLDVMTKNIREPPEELNFVMHSVVWSRSNRGSWTTRCPRQCWVSRADIYVFNEISNVFSPSAWQSRDRTPEKFLKLVSCLFLETKIANSVCENALKKRPNFQVIFFPVVISACLLHVVHKNTQIKLYV